jgi:hypothetical protein
MPNKIATAVTVCLPIVGIFLCLQDKTLFAPLVTQLGLESDGAGTLSPLSAADGRPSNTSEAKYFNATSIHTCKIGNETVTIPTVPTFIIIGAQNSGTTALGVYLKQHPSQRYFSTKAS